MSCHELHELKTNNAALIRDNSRNSWERNYSFQAPYALKNKAACIAYFHFRETNSVLSPPQRPEKRALLLSLFSVCFLLLLLLPCI